MGGGGLALAARARSFLSTLASCFVRCWFCGAPWPLVETFTRLNLHPSTIEQEPLCFMLLVSKTLYTGLEISNFQLNFGSWIILAPTANL